MNLDTEKARQAGRDVLTGADELKAAQVPDSLRSGSGRLQGLALADALTEAGEGYTAYLKRFGDELEWLGNAVISAADLTDQTDEAASASIKQLDIPA